MGRLLIVLSLRTRAERISFMLLFHLTLILKKATSERSHASLLESDEVAATHPSPLSAAPASRVCVRVSCQRVHTHTHTQRTHGEKSSLYPAEQPHTHLHQVHSGSALESSTALGRGIRSRPPAEKTAV